MANKLKIIHGSQLPRKMENNGVGVPNTNLQLKWKIMRQDIEICKVIVTIKENDRYPGKKIRRQQSHTICLIWSRHADKSPNSIYNFIIRMPKAISSFEIWLSLRSFSSYELVVQCLETAGTWKVDKLQQLVKK